MVLEEIHDEFLIDGMLEMKIVFKDEFKFFFGISERIVII